MSVITPGMWHQLGWNQMSLARDLLARECGVGIVLSPRDATLGQASELVQPRLVERSPAVLVDPQFHVPSFHNKQTATYPWEGLRRTLSRLTDVEVGELDELSSHLESVNRRLASRAVVAPAVVYQAGRPDIIELNRRLFFAARRAADELGIPTVATVVLGDSLRSTDVEIATILSAVTQLPLDALYFGFEFSGDGLPADRHAVERFCGACLTLASSTGKDVLHAFAGPMALLSVASGATSVAVAPVSSLWSFQQRRYRPAKGGGGGASNPRFFSASLWSTVVVPDEPALMSDDLRARILVHTDYSAPLRQSLEARWPKGQVQRHLVATIEESIKAVMASGSLASRLQSVIDHLGSAQILHGKMREAKIPLRPDSEAPYLSPWLEALGRLQRERGDDIEAWDWHWR